MELWCVLSFEYFSQHGDVSRNYKLILSHVSDLFVCNFFFAIRSNCVRFATYNLEV
jgi:hypothetical protein